MNSSDSGFSDTLNLPLCQGMITGLFGVLFSLDEVIPKCCEQSVVIIYR